MGFAGITIPEGNVAKITAGGVVLWEKVTGKIPKEYQEVEWIGTTGTQYIAFNEALDTVNEMTFTVEFTEYYGSYICGAHSDLPCFFLTVRMSKSAQGLDFYSGSGSAYKRYANVALNTVYDICMRTDLGNSSNAFAILQNGNTLWSSSSTVEETALSISPYGIGGNPYATSRLKGKIHAYQHKRNGVIVRDFIPCYRKSDGVIGMYDLVSKTLFTNAGSGSFTKGADV